MWWYEQQLNEDIYTEELELADGDIDVAIERAVRRQVSEKLREWFRGVAAWGPENKARAVASAQRMVALGYLQPMSQIPDNSVRNDVPGVGKTDERPQGRLQGRQARSQEPGRGRTKAAGSVV